MSRGEIMKYQNNSIDAVLELERQRTGRYGSDYEEESKICSCCGYADPEEFYMADGKCIGCSSCISRVDWEEYMI